jgi:hypothetical protein
LHDLVDAGPLGIRAILTEAGNTGENDVRLDLLELLIGNPKPLFDIRAEILHHHVAASDQFLQYFAGIRLL